MIGIDTNILVRYLVRDDAAQTGIVDRIIESAEDSGDPIFINHIVLSEMVWVLAKGYRVDKGKLAEMLEAMLDSPAFAYEDKDSILGALRDYRGSAAGFVDCLIGRKNRNLGCEGTATFDAQAVKLDTFRHPDRPTTT